MPLHLDAVAQEREGNVVQAASGSLLNLRVPTKGYKEMCEGKDRWKPAAPEERPQKRLLPFSCPMGRNHRHTPLTASDIKIN